MTTTRRRRLDMAAQLQIAADFVFRVRQWWYSVLGRMLDDAALVTACIFAHAGRLRQTQHGNKIEMLNGC